MSGPVCRFIRMLDDDARKAWHGCHEVAAYHRHFPVYFILFMDMLGSAGSGKESGVRYMAMAKAKNKEVAASS